MKIIESIITEDEVEIFKNYWENNADKRHVNWTDGDQLVDIHCSLSSDTSEFQIIKSIVAKDFPDTIDIWCAYRQQSFAHNIHVDDYGIEKNYPAYTYIISLDTVPEFKPYV